MAKLVSKSDDNVDVRWEDSYGSYGNGITNLPSGKLTQINQLLDTIPISAVAKSTFRWQKSPNGIQKVCYGRNPPLLDKS